VLAAEPYPGAVESVNDWHEAGPFIHITSHRATDAHEATARWLDATGFRYDELYCSYDKVARCVEIGIDVLIDDSPVNLDRAAGAGITAATIRHPWNAGRDSVVYGDDWPELRSALQPFITQRFSP
jgi:5'(3')-deoxyribonucleotidase